MAGPEGFLGRAGHPAVGRKQSSWGYGPPLLVVVLPPSLTIEVSKIEPLPTPAPAGVAKLASPKIGSASSSSSVTTSTPARPSTAKVVHPRIASITKKNDD